ncbi:MAG TPA: MOSC domain-containing protein [Propionibacteriaceae bacterium]|nr:MOSC domain-containing protein [Propionibacteriaceae bacterium]
MAVLESVNLGRPRPNPYKPVEATGIGKEPVSGPVEVRDPGPKRVGLGSGLVGDYIGDRKHHGGDEQAVYAFQREDLDRWEERLGRSLPTGFFGENLTTSGIDVNEARVGERWRIGDEVELAVTAPRIPCSTFRGWMGEKGWAKMFAADARSGTYLRVLRAGTIQAGDPITVLHRPDHDVTVSLYFRSQMNERHLLPRLLEAGDDLPAETRRDVERYLARTGAPRAGRRGRE